MLKNQKLKIKNQNEIEIRRNLLREINRNLFPFPEYPGLRPWMRRAGRRPHVVARQAPVAGLQCFTE